MQPRGGCLEGSLGENAVRIHKEIPKTNKDILQNV